MMRDSARWAGVKQLQLRQGAALAVEADRLVARADGRSEHWWGITKLLVKERGSVVNSSEYEVTKSDEQWREDLNPAEYAVLRQAATERPGTGRSEERRVGKECRCWWGQGQ